MSPKNRVRRHLQSYLGITSVIFASTAISVSCSKVEDSHEVRIDECNIAELIRPLRFGDILGPLGNPLIAAMVSPSQIRPAIDVTLAKDIRAQAILGDEDRICRVRILDSEFRVFSLSLASTYKEIKSKFPLVKPISYHGYAIEVPIRENIVFAFFPWDGVPRDDQRPHWIDLLPEHPDENCRYASARR